MASNFVFYSDYMLVLSSYMIIQQLETVYLLRLYVGSQFLHYHTTENLLIYRLLAHHMEALTQLIGAMKATMMTLTMKAMPTMTMTTMMSMMMPPLKEMMKPIPT